MRRWWLPRSRPAGTAADEAASALERLERHDPEVKQLGDELRERQAMNNFSGMVAAAIARVAAGPR
ncbi:MAG TPA: hypothetical protein VHK64_05440 [Nocardioidaceae bacterium]|nr:hypothetical protein [Nocardioidaceae bacterium]